MEQLFGSPVHVGRGGGGGGGGEKKWEKKKEGNPTLKRS